MEEYKVEEKSAALTNKAIIWVKNNAINFIIFIVCGVFIASGIIRIDKTGNTISDIIASGFLSGLLSICLKMLFGKKGIMSGFNSPSFIAAANIYGTKIDKVGSNSDKLQAYCDYHNSNELKKRQQVILARASLSYEPFINGEYDHYLSDSFINTKSIKSKEEKDKALKINYEIKTRKEALLRVKKIKIFEITPEILMNAVNVTESSDNTLRKSVRKHESLSLVQYVLGGFCFLIIFGMYGPKLKDFQWVDILWTTLQISVYLLLGGLQYLESYQFITIDIKSKVNIINGYLDEFESLLMYKPDLFQEKGE